MYDNDIINKEIGHMLWEKRKALGMTQMELADELGISYQQVQKYEYGSCRLSVSRLLHICYALQCEPAEFITTLLANLDAMQ